MIKQTQLDDCSLPEPTIVVVTRDGFLKAEWHSQKTAALLNLNLNGKITFATTNDDSQDLYGMSGKELALRTIAPS